MWYSTKGKNYKIGYAESDDGIKWRRKSLKHYKILKKYYEKAVTKCPRYYS